MDYPINITKQQVFGTQKADNPIATQPDLQQYKVETEGSTVAVEKHTARD